MNEVYTLNKYCGERDPERVCREASKMNLPTSCNNSQVPIHEIYKRGTGPQHRLHRARYPTTFPEFVYNSGARKQRPGLNLFVKIPTDVICGLEVVKGHPTRPRVVEPFCRRMADLLLVMVC